MAVGVSRRATLRGLAAATLAVLLPRSAAADEDGVRPQADPVCPAPQYACRTICCGPDQQCVNLTRPDGTDDSRCLPRCAPGESRCAVPYPEGSKTTSAPLGPCCARCCRTICCGPDQQCVELTKPDLTDDSRCLPRCGPNERRCSVPYPEGSTTTTAPLGPCCPEGRECCGQTCCAAGESCASPGTTGALRCIPSCGGLFGDRSRRCPTTDGTLGQCCPDDRFCCGNGLCCARGQSCRGGRCVELTASCPPTRPTRCGFECCLSRLCFRHPDGTLGCSCPAGMTPRASEVGATVAACIVVSPPRCPRPDQIPCGDNPCCDSDRCCSDEVSGELVCCRRPCVKRGGRLVCPRPDPCPPPGRYCQDGKCCVPPAEVCIGKPTRCCKRGTIACPGPTGCCPPELRCCAGRCCPAGHKCVGLGQCRRFCKPGERFCGPKDECCPRIDRLTGLPRVCCEGECCRVRQICELHADNRRRCRVPCRPTQRRCAIGDCCDHSNNCCGNTCCRANEICDKTRRCTPCPPTKPRCGAKCCDPKKCCGHGLVCCDPAFECIGQRCVPTGPP